MAIPEGPGAPAFKRSPKPGDPWEKPLDLVVQYIPDPLPAPLHQGADCLGGDLIVKLADGSKITYGPCDRPGSINSLRAAMIYVVTHGRCSPHCGPNMEMPPQIKKDGL
ncbi:MAG: hypothetical protein ACXVP3_04915 [Actinomycetota bacterium]